LCCDCNSITTYTMHILQEIKTALSRLLDNPNNNIQSLKQMELGNNEHYCMPTFMWSDIFEFLSGIDLLKVMQVCKSWNLLTQSASIWLTVCGNELYPWNKKYLMPSTKTYTFTKYLLKFNWFDQSLSGLYFSTIERR
jgi:hypothetical protein